MFNTNQNNAEFCYIDHGNQHKCLSYLSLIHLNTYGMLWVYNN